MKTPLHQRIMDLQPDLTEATARLLSREIGDTPEIRAGLISATVRGTTYQFPLSLLDLDGDDQ